jgi:hypothetical protein
MWYSVWLHVDPGPGILLVLPYEPLEDENNNTNKPAALLDRAPDACAENEVGPPRPSLRRYACTLAEKPHIQGPLWPFNAGTIALTERHPCSSLRAPSQLLDTLIPIRTTRTHPLPMYTSV